MGNLGPSIAASDWWRKYGPGSKEIVGGVVLAFLGFAAWLAQSGYVISTLFDIEPLWGFIDTGFLSFTFLACGLLSFLGGVLLPKGFYLWGVAVYLHAPFAEIMVVAAMQREGIGLVGGNSGLVSYSIITAMFIVLAMMFFTALSALGMGTRYLASKVR